MQLAEKHRPREWSQVIAQDKAIARLLAIRDRTGFGGRAFWITGRTGTGKTTIARLIAAEVADPFCTEEIDAGQLTVDRLREIERTMQLYGFGARSGRAWIINEAHGLRAQTVRALKTLLELIPDHVVFIFTTTRAEEGLLFDGAEDARPLVGRCTPVPLTTQGLAKPAARWLRKIAQAEGLNGKPEAAYVRLFNESAGSFREALQRIDAGAMLGDATGGKPA